MKRKGAAIKNSLTELFSHNPNPSIEEVLGNSDVSSSIRYEIPQLLNYLIPEAHSQDTNEKDAPHLMELLNFALKLETPESRWPPSLETIAYRRNSANILSASSTKLNQRLLSSKLLITRLIRFITQTDPNSTVYNYEYAGHFCRILEHLLRANQKKPEACDQLQLTKIREILHQADKMKICSYLNLLVLFYSDFNRVIFPGTNEDESLKKGAEEIMKNITNIAKNPLPFDHLHLYFKLILGIREQNEALLSFFTINHIDFLIQITVLFSKNLCRQFEQCRCINFIVANYPNPADLNKYDKTLISHITKTDNVFSLLFKSFWKISVQSSKMANIITLLFSENNRTEGFWYGRQCFLQALTEMDSESRNIIATQTQIIANCIKYQEQFENSKDAIPDFIILNIIKQLSVPLEDGKSSVSVNPIDKTNPLNSQSWAKTVFWALTILNNADEESYQAKQNFISPDFWMK